MHLKTELHKFHSISLYQDTAKFVYTLLTERVYCMCLPQKGPQQFLSHRMQHFCHFGSAVYWFGQRATVPPNQECRVQDLWLDQGTSHSRPWNAKETGSTAIWTSRHSSGHRTHKKN